MSQLHLKQRRSAQQKHRRTGSLNLVSLMDIFTILVFFLMVNSSEVEVLQTSSSIKLPDSTSEQRPDNRLVVSISQEDLVLQGRPVARVADLADPSVTVIGGLAEELAYHANRKGEIPEGGYEITIMGDRELPYWLLKKVILTCQSTDFARVSLAVNRMTVSAPGADGAVTAADAAVTAGAVKLDASAGQEVVAGEPS